MPFKPSVLILFACLTSAALADVAIVDVNLIDVERDRVLSGQTVLIEGGSISRIGSIAPEAIPPGAERIQGTGRFLIPGLWDMHVHMHSKRSPEITMPLFIAHGVTGVREMNSPRPGAEGMDSTYATKRRWAEEVEAGQLLGPRILSVASFAVNGPEGTGPGAIGPEEPSFFGAATEEDARELARHLKRQGVDLIKIYYGIPRDSFFALAEEANKLGLQLGGHKPRAVSAIEASNAGMRTFEHARVFVHESFGGAARLRARARRPGRRALLAMVSDHDPAMADEIFETFARNGTWFCPTHLTRKMDAFASDEDYRSDPRLEYIGARYRIAWAVDAYRYVDQDGTTRKRDAFMGVYRLGLELTGRAHAAGVKILAGTDATDTYSFPGSGLHDELELLVEAGLTPGDALRSATLLPAEYLERTERFGSIAEGKAADLILLDGNPLEDISNVRRISGVIFRGEHLSAARLEQMKAGVRAAVQTP